MVLIVVTIQQAKELQAVFRAPQLVRTQGRACVSSLAVQSLVALQSLAPEEATGKLAEHGSLSQLRPYFVVTGLFDLLQLLAKDKSYMAPLVKRMRHPTTMVGLLIRLRF
jgi:hypothetical protein